MSFTNAAKRHTDSGNGENVTAVWVPNKSAEYD